MIIQIIGWYAIVSAALGIIALLASIIQGDQVADGARARVQFLIIAALALAVWCFK